MLSCWERRDRLIFLMNILKISSGMTGSCKNQGKITAVTAIVIVVMLLSVFFVINPTLDYVAISSERESYFSNAKFFATSIESLPLIDVSPILNGLDVIDRVNLLIRMINEAFKTDFPKLDRENQALINDVQELIPLVAPYNDLILSARNYRDNDSDTAKQLFINAYSLAFGVIMVEGKIAYSIAFKTTGFLNNVLKIGKMRTLFGDVVYSKLLSKIHWYFRDYITTLPSELSKIVYSVIENRWI